MFRRKDRDSWLMLGEYGGEARRREMRRDDAMLLLPLWAFML